MCRFLYTETVITKNYDKAVHFLRKGAPFIAANPDWVCPMPADEVLPDCGSICALLTAATGVKPTYIGKPDRNMVDIISKQDWNPQLSRSAASETVFIRISLLHRTLAPFQYVSFPERPQWI